MWSKTDVIGEKNFRQSARERLTQSSEQFEHKTGSIRIWKKNKDEAKLFFRNGNLVSVEASMLPLNVQNFVLASEHLAQRNHYREQVQEYVESRPNDSDAEFVQFLGTRQLFPDAELNTYIRERFIDAIIEVFRWEEVNAEWRANDQPSGPLMAPIKAASTYDFIGKVESHFTLTTLKDWGLDPHRVGEVAYLATITPEPTTTQNDWNRTLLLSHAQHEPKDLVSTAEAFGLPLWRAKNTIHSLWHEGLVNVLIDGTVYTNTLPENQEIDHEAAPTPAPVVEVQQEQQVPVVEVESSAPLDENPLSAEDSSEELEVAAAPVELHVEESPQVPPSPEESVEETHEDFIEESEPTIQPEEELTSMTEAYSQPNEAVEPAAAPFTAPVEVPQTPAVSVEQPVASFAAPPQAGAANKVQSLIAQLKEELSNLDAQADEVKTSLEQRKATVHQVVASANAANERYASVSSQLNELSTQRDALMHEIQTYNTQYEAATQEVVALESQLQDIQAQKTSITALFNN